MEVASTAPFETPSAAQTPLEGLIADPTQFETPLDHATLREIHSVPGGRGIFIIHIQDPHSNLSGQQNLAAAIDRIMTRYGVSLILSEGGADDCSLTDLKKIAPPEVWKRLAKSYLMDGKITGEEYLNLTSDHPMKIMGLEDIMLYLKSVQKYADLADKRAEILEYLKLIRRAVSKLKKRLYPAELALYEEKKERDGPANGGQFESGFRALMELAQSRKIDLSEFPNVMKLIELQLKEKLINFELANLEQADLVEELSKRGGADDLKAFLQKSGRMKGEKASQFTYFQNTLNIAQDKGVLMTKYPNLVRYGEYLRDFSDLDLDQILEELAAAEDKVVLSFLTTEDQKLIRAIDRYTVLLQTAYNIQMSTSEFALFKANEPDFGTLPYLAFVNRKLAEAGYFGDLIPYKDLIEKGKEALEAFYESVTQRDFAFLKNAERILKEEGQKVAVLISGGYHTPHLKKLFREKGYAYAVLTPTVTSETNQAKYEKLLISPIRPDVKRVETAQGERRADRSLSALEKDLARPKKKSEGVRAALTRAIDSEKAKGIVPGSEADRLILERFRNSVESELGAFVEDALKSAGATDIESRKQAALAELKQGARLAASVGESAVPSGGLAADTTAVRRDASAAEVIRSVDESVWSQAVRDLGLELGDLEDRLSAAAREDALGPRDSRARRGADGRIDSVLLVSGVNVDGRDLKLAIRFAATRPGADGPAVIAGWMKELAEKAVAGDLEAVHIVIEETAGDAQKKALADVAASFGFTASETLPGVWSIDPQVLLERATAVLAVPAPQLSQVAAVDEARSDERQEAMAEEDRRRDEGRRYVVGRIDFEIKVQKNRDLAVQRILETLRETGDLSDMESAALKWLKQELLNHNRQTALRRSVSEGDRIITFVQRNVKPYNTITGPSVADGIIARRQVETLNLLRQYGILSPEEGGLSWSYKQDKFVLKAPHSDKDLAEKLTAVFTGLKAVMRRYLWDDSPEQGGLRLWENYRQEILEYLAQKETAATGKIVTVSDLTERFTPAQLERKAREELAFTTDIGFSQPVGKELSADSDDAKLNADFEALRAAKIARRKNEADPRVGVSAFSSQEFDTLSRQAMELRGKLGLEGAAMPSESGMLEVRGLRESELPEGSKKNLKKYLDLVGLFENPSDPIDAVGRDRVNGILDAFDRAIEDRAPPDLEQAVVEAASVLKTSRKDPSFTKGDSFHSAVADKSGFIVSADAIGFYPFVAARAAQAHLEYQKRAAEPFAALREALGAENDVRSMMADRRNRLMEVLKDSQLGSVTLDNGQTVKLAYQEGGDEITLFAEKLDEADLKRLAEALPDLGLRIAIAEHQPHNGRSRINYAVDLTRVSHGPYGEAFKNATDELDAELKKWMLEKGGSAFIFEKAGADGKFETRFIPSSGARLAARTEEGVGAAVLDDQAAINAEIAVRVDAEDVATTGLDDAVSIFNRERQEGKAGQLSYYLLDVPPTLEQMKSLPKNSPFEIGLVRLRDGRWLVYSNKAMEGKFVMRNAFLQGLIEDGLIDIAMHTHPGEQIAVPSDADLKVHAAPRPLPRPMKSYVISNGGIASYDAEEAFGRVIVDSEVFRKSRDARIRDFMTWLNDYKALYQSGAAIDPFEFYTRKAIRGGAEGRPIVFAKQVKDLRYYPFDGLSPQDAARPDAEVMGSVDTLMNSMGIYSEGSQTLEPDQLAHVLREMGLDLDDSVEDELAGALAADEQLSKEEKRPSDSRLHRGADRKVDGFLVVSPAGDENLPMKMAVWYVAETDSPTGRIVTAGHMKELALRAKARGLETVYFVLPNAAAPAGRQREIAEDRFGFAGVEGPWEGILGVSPDVLLARAEAELGGIIVLTPEKAEDPLGVLETLPKDMPSLSTEFDLSSATVENEKGRLSLNSAVFTIRDQDGTEWVAKILTPKEARIEIAGEEKTITSEQLLAREGLMMGQVAEETGLAPKPVVGRLSGAGEIQTVKDMIRQKAKDPLTDEEARNTEWFQNPDAWIGPGTLFIATPKVSGEKLTDRIDRLSGEYAREGRANEAFGGLLKSLEGAVKAVILFREKGFSHNDLGTDEFFMDPAGGTRAVLDWGGTSSRWTGDPKNDLMRQLEFQAKGSMHRFSLPVQVMEMNKEPGLNEYRDLLGVISILDSSLGTLLAQAEPTAEVKDYRDELGRITKEVLQKVGRESASSERPDLLRAKGYVDQKIREILRVVQKASAGITPAAPKVSEVSAKRAPPSPDIGVAAKLRRALSNFFRYLFKKEAARSAGTVELGVPPGHVQVKFVLDREALKTLEEGRGQLRVRRAGGALTKVDARGIDPQMIKELRFYTFDPANPDDLKPANIQSAWAGPYQSIQSLGRALAAHLGNRGLVEEGLGFSLVVAVPSSGARLAAQKTVPQEIRAPSAETGPVRTESEEALQARIEKLPVSEEIKDHLRARVRDGAETSRAHRDGGLLVASAVDEPILEDQSSIPILITYLYGENENEKVELDLLRDLAEQAADQGEEFVHWELGFMGTDEEIGQSVRQLHLAKALGFQIAREGGVFSDITEEDLKGSLPPAAVLRISSKDLLTRIDRHVSGVDLTDGTERIRNEIRNLLISNLALQDAKTMRGFEAGWRALVAAMNAIPSVADRRLVYEQLLREVKGDSVRPRLLSVGELVPASRFWSSQKPFMMRQYMLSKILESKKLGGKTWNDFYSEVLEPNTLTVPQIEAILDELIGRLAPIEGIVSGRLGEDHMRKAITGSTPFYLDANFKIAYRKLVRDAEAANAGQNAFKDLILWIEANIEAGNEAEAGKAFASLSSAVKNAARDRVIEAAQRAGMKPETSTQEFEAMWNEKTAAIEKRPLWERAAILAALSNELPAMDLVALGRGSNVIGSPIVGAIGERFDALIAQAYAPPGMKQEAEAFLRRAALKGEKPEAQGSTAVIYDNGDKVWKLELLNPTQAQAALMSPEDVQLEVERRLQAEGALAETSHARVEMPVDLEAQIKTLQNKPLLVKWPKGREVAVTSQKRVSILSGLGVDTIAPEDKKEFDLAIKALKDHLVSVLWGRLGIFNADLRRNNVGYVYDGKEKVTIQEFDVGFMRFMPEGREATLEFLMDDQNGQYLPQGYMFLWNLMNRDKVLGRELADVILEPHFRANKIGKADQPAEAERFLKAVDDTFNRARKALEGVSGTVEERRSAFVRALKAEIDREGSDGWVLRNLVENLATVIDEAQKRERQAGLPAGQAGARLAETPNLDKLIARGVPSLFHATTPETVEEMVFKEHPEIPGYQTGYLDNRGKMGASYGAGPRFASKEAAARHYAETLGGVSLQFDIQKIRELGIDIQPFGEIQATQPVPMSAMTDQSKQAVFKLISDRKGGVFTAEEEAKLMQALGYENWDRMVSALAGARLAQEAASVSEFVGYFDQISSALSDPGVLTPAVLAERPHLKNFVIAPKDIENFMRGFEDAQYDFQGMVDRVADLRKQAASADKKAAKEARTELGKNFWLVKVIDALELAMIKSGKSPPKVDSESKRSEAKALLEAAYQKKTHEEMVGKAKKLTGDLESAVRELQKTRGDPPLFEFERNIAANENDAVARLQGLEGLYEKMLAGKWDAKDSRALITLLRELYLKTLFMTAPKYPLKKEFEEAAAHLSAQLILQAREKGLRDLIPAILLFAYDSGLIDHDLDNRKADGKTGKSELKLALQTLGLQAPFKQIESELPKDARYMPSIEETPQPMKPLGAASHSEIDGMDIREKTGRNWYWDAMATHERERVKNRLHALLQSGFTEFVRGAVSELVEGLVGKDVKIAKINIVVHGSYLYSPDDMKGTDIDTYAYVTLVDANGGDATARLEQALGLARPIKLPLPADIRNRIYENAYVRNRSRMTDWMDLTVKSKATMDISTFGPNTWGSGFAVYGEDPIPVHPPNETLIRQSIQLLQNGVDKLVEVSVDAGEIEASGRAPESPRDRLIAGLKSRILEGRKMPEESEDRFTERFGKLAKRLTAATLILSRIDPAGALRPTFYEDGFVELTKEIAGSKNDPSIQIKAKAKFLFLIRSGYMKALREAHRLVHRHAGHSAVLYDAIMAKLWDDLEFATHGADAGAISAGVDTRGALKERDSFYSDFYDKINGAEGSARVGRLAKITEMISGARLAVQTAASREAAPKAEAPSMRLGPEKLKALPLFLEKLGTELSLMKQNQTNSQALDKLLDDLRAPEFETPEFRAYQNGDAYRAYRDLQSEARLYAAEVALRELNLSTDPEVRQTRLALRTAVGFIQAEQLEVDGRTGDAKSLRDWALEGFKKDSPADKAVLDLSSVLNYFKYQRSSALLGVARRAVRKFKDESRAVVSPEVLDARLSDTESRLKAVDSYVQNEIEKRKEDAALLGELRLPDRRRLAGFKGGKIEVVSLSNLSAVLKAEKGGDIIYFKLNFKEGLTGDPQHDTERRFSLDAMELDPSKWEAAHYQRLKDYKGWDAEKHLPAEFGFGYFDRSDEDGRILLGALESHLEGLLKKKRPTTKDIKDIGTAREKIAQLSQPGALRLKPYFYTSEAGKQTFASYIHRLYGEPLAPEEKERLAGYFRTIVGEILSPLHEIDWAHRDAKPGQFLIDPADPDTSKIKMVDFGTSSGPWKEVRIGAMNPASRLDHSPEYGTSELSAPEQAVARDDLFTFVMLAQITELFGLRDVLSRDEKTEKRVLEYLETVPGERQAYADRFAREDGGKDLPSAGEILRAFENILKKEKLKAALPLLVNQAIPAGRVLVKDRFTTQDFGREKQAVRTELGKKTLPEIINVLARETDTLAVYAQAAHKGALGTDLSRRLDALVAKRMPESVQRYEKAKTRTLANIGAQNDPKLGLDEIVTAIEILEGSQAGARLAKDETTAVIGRDKDARLKSLRQRLSWALPELVEKYASIKSVYGLDLPALNLDVDIPRARLEDLNRASVELEPIINEIRPLAEGLLAAGERDFEGLDFYRELERSMKSLREAAAQLRYEEGPIETSQGARLAKQASADRIQEAVKKGWTPGDERLFHGTNSYALHHFEKAGFRLLSQDGLRASNIPILAGELGEGAGLNRSRVSVAIGHYQGAENYSKVSLRRPLGKTPDPETYKQNQLRQLEHQEKLWRDVIENLTREIGAEENADAKANMQSALKNRLEPMLELILRRKSDLETAAQDGSLAAFLASYPVVFQFSPEKVRQSGRETVRVRNDIGIPELGVSDHLALDEVEALYVPEGKISEIAEWKMRTRSVLQERLRLAASAQDRANYQSKIEALDAIAILAFEDMETLRAAEPDLSRVSRTRLTELVRTLEEEPTEFVQRFTSVFGARLSQVLVKPAQAAEMAITDADTMTLIARALLDPQLTKGIAEETALQFKAGNAVVSARLAKDRQSGSVTFHDPARREAPVTLPIPAEAFAQAQARPVITEAEREAVVAGLEEAAALEALDEFMKEFRNFARYNQSLPPADIRTRERVILAVPVEGRSPDELKFLRDLFDAMKPRLRNEFFLVFTSAAVLRSDGKPDLAPDAEVYRSDALPAFEGEKLPKIMVAADPDAALLDKIRGKTGMLPVPQSKTVRGAMQVANYGVAMMLTDMMTGLTQDELRALAQNNRFRQLLKAGIQDKIISDEDPVKTLRYLREVKDDLTQEDVVYYKKIVFDFLKPLSIRQLFELATLITKAVGAAA
jgi:hypothetical protein